MMFEFILAAIRGSSIFSLLIKKAKSLAFLKDESAVASLEIIGKGFHGVVFKAELPGCNGKIVAVKKMSYIRSEISTVGQIRHRNLLPLLAHVSRPECHFFIYEFMKNGSLQDILTDVAAGNRELTWPARYKIAIGLAAGLEYLHIDHSPRIIHSDLKLANVLLDDDMEARISGFEHAMAYIVPDEMSLNKWMRKKMTSENPSIAIDPKFMEQRIR